MRLARALAFLCALLAAAPALAQSTVLQGGPTTPAHVPMYSGSGFTQPIIQDGGGSGGVSTNGFGNPSEIGITSRSPSNTYPSANSGHGPLGEHFCMFDGPTTNPTGYHYLCFDPNAQGGGLIDYGSGGAATPGPFNINVNGATYPFPFVVGGIVGPSTTTVGDLACWNNTTGTLLKDCVAGPLAFLTPIGTGVTTALGNAVNSAGGFATYPIVSSVTNTILSALPATTSPTIRNGALTPGDSDLRLFAASGTACSINGGNGDAGSQVPINNPTTHAGCWNAFLPNDPDILGWGALCDGSNTDPAGANTAALTAAVTWANTNKSNLKAPPKPCYSSTGITLQGITIRGVVFDPQQDTDLYYGSGIRCGLTVSCVNFALTGAGSTNHTGQTALQNFTIYRDQGTITASTADCLNIQAWWWSLDHVSCNGHYNGLHDIGALGSGLIGVVHDFSTCNIAGSDIDMDGAAELRMDNFRLGCNSNKNSSNGVVSRITTHNNYWSITGVNAAPGPASIYAVNGTMNDSLNPTCGWNWNNIQQMPANYGNVIEYNWSQMHYEITGAISGGGPAAVFCSDGSSPTLPTVNMTDIDIFDFDGTDSVFNFAGVPSVLSAWTIKGGTWAGFASSGHNCDFTTGGIMFGLLVSGVTFENCAVNATGASQISSATVNAGGTGYGATATGTLTWTGTGCSVNPVLNVTTNSSGVVTTINSVPTTGVCSPTLPSSSATTWAAAGGLTAGSGATFNLIASGSSNISFDNNSYGNGVSVAGSFLDAYFCGTLHSGSTTSTVLTPNTVNFCPALPVRWPTFTPVLTCSSSGAPAYTPTATSYLLQGKSIQWNGAIVITGAGSCSGTVLVSLPAAPFGPITITGSDATAGAEYYMRTTATGTTAGLIKYDGTSTPPTAAVISWNTVYQAN